MCAWAAQARHTLTCTLVDLFASLHRALKEQLAHLLLQTMQPPRILVRGLGIKAPEELRPECSLASHVVANVDDDAEVVLCDAE